MSDTVTVWNVTPATKETPTDLRMYGKVIKPGSSARVDASWVRQYPKPLTSAETSKTVYVGEALPQWYDEALEEQMKKITHNGQAPSIVKGKGFHPTEMNPGDSFEVEDDVAEALELEDQPWMSVTDAEPEEVEAEETEEETEAAADPVEEPKAKKKAAKKEAPKKRNIRRKKKGE
jgi:hypothetical protein